MLSFIKNVLLKDVCHVDIFVRLGDVQVGFGILIYCFVQQLSYLLCCTPTSSIFNPLFPFTPPSFKCLDLRSGCFDSLEIPLAHKHASFPITFGGIEFILTTTMVAAIYLRSFVISIIVVRFVVNQHPFLLEVLA